jgi:hypothetical protein
MPRRIEVELTSAKDDGTWTWRAAGAKQPKGELDGQLLYPGVKVGDVVRADAEFFVDGITVVAVLPPKARHRQEPERIEILGSPRRDEQLVTTTLVGKGGRDRGDRGDRGDRPKRRDDRRGGGERRERTGDGGRPARAKRSDSGEQRREGRREQKPRATRPAPPAKPKAPRLRAGRTHRNEMLASLPEEHKPIAEQILRGGIPGVRQAVDKQNEANRAAGQPTINPAPLIAIAEQLLPPLRTAEWRDRAEAALEGADVLDLRDLRSVVVAAEQGARDDETRQLADQIRDALNRRVEAEHQEWLAEVDQTLRENRVVRALRLSSRPPKAGAPLPVELAARLAEATAANLTADTSPDRFATVLDALVFAPVRTQVTAQSIPAEPTPELIAAVKKASSRLPQIAEQFGIEPSQPAGRRRPKRSRTAPPPPPPPMPASAPAPTIEPTPPDEAVGTVGHQTVDHGAVDADASEATIDQHEQPPTEPGAGEPADTAADVRTDGPADQALDDPVQTTGSSVEQA